MAQVYRAAGILAARAASDAPEMDDAAERIADNARAIAAQHFETGNYESKIGTERIRGKRGVTDRIAYADDPAATFIEWGHMTRTSEGGTPHWVPGLHIMARAAGLQ